MMPDRMPNEKSDKMNARWSGRKNVRRMSAFIENRQYARNCQNICCFQHLSANNMVLNGMISDVKATHSDMAAMFVHMVWGPARRKSCMFCACLS